jgi:hypothetical protein
LNEYRDEVGKGARHVSFAGKVVTEQHIPGSEFPLVAVTSHDLSFTRQDEADVGLGCIVGGHVRPGGYRKGKHAFDGVLSQIAFLKALKGLISIFFRQELPILLDFSNLGRIENPYGFSQFCYLRQNRNYCV